MAEDNSIVNKFQKAKSRETQIYQEETTTRLVLQEE